MSDVLAKLTPQGLEALAERARSHEFDTLAAGFMLRRAMGVPVGVDMRRPVGVHEMPPEFTEIELTPAQALALAALLEGKTHAEAAQRAGVCRETVTHWANRDPNFVAAYQNGKVELLAAATAELRMLVKDAVGAMRDLLTQTGDLSVRHKVAMQILGSFGVMSPGEYAWTTPQEVEARWLEAERHRKIHKAEAENDLKLREALALYVDAKDGE
jgi:hypothetical protein